MTALLRMLERKARNVWIGYGLAFVFATAIPISNWATLQTAMGKLRFVAMDSRSTFYLTSAGSFEQTSQLHAELARMAAETIFNRHPDGFDAPERLDRLFSPDTTIQLREIDAAKDADVFRSQQIHQKIETGEIKELSVDDNTALVSVEGQVLRQGLFNGKIVNDTKKVTVFIRLELNNDMARNGRYPLVVTKYEEVWR